MALKGTSGTTMHTVSRRQLKPKRQPSDAQLLKSAERMAQRAAKQQERERRAESQLRDIKRQLV